MIPNMDIRFEARAAGVALWKIAKQLNVSENTLIRWLRDDITADLKSQIREIIKKQSAESR